MAPVVAFGVLLVLFLPLMKEIRSAADLLRTANWLWLPLILLIQIVSYASLTWLNLMVLSLFPGKISFVRMCAMLTSMSFIAVAIPSAGVSGIALRAHLLGKYGFTTEAAAFSLALETVFLSAVMAFVGSTGFFYLVQRGELAALQIAGLIVLMAIFIFLVWGGWRTLLDENRSRQMALTLAENWNRAFFVRRRPTILLDLTQVDQRLVNFRSQVRQISTLPLAWLLAAAFGRVFLDVVTLGVCFRMFGAIIFPGRLLIGYGLMLLLSSLASLPGGLGLADVSVPVLFTRLGVPGPVALAGGLLYRLIAFWLMRFIGFFSWQVLER
jgi:uncharacterized protein (TIRG00374 family)